ncbi:MAG: hypothetical protein ACYDEJ_17140 [Desulfitobacteriaceae bacterium]
MILFSMRCALLRNLYMAVWHGLANMALGQSAKNPPLFQWGDELAI